MLHHPYQPGYLTPWPCPFEFSYSKLFMLPFVWVVIRSQQARIWVKCATHFCFNGAEAFAGFQDAPLVAPLVHKPAIQRKTSARRASSAKTNYPNPQNVPKSHQPNPFRRLVFHSGLADPPGNEQESTLSAVWWDVQPAISLHYGSCRLTTLRWAWVA